MPKKHRQRLYTKPLSTPPVTLASSSSSSISTPRHHHHSHHASSPSPSQTQLQTVNGLLTHLRLTQAPSDPTATPALFSAQQPTLPPSLNSILGVENTPQANLLRPRPSAVGSRAPPRTTAGPPPPRSWVTTTRRGAADTTTTTTAPAAGKHERVEHPTGGLRNVYRLPGMARVGERSLMHYALVKMAREWETVVVYEKHYLPTLRPALKSLLVAYVGAYGPGVGKRGLNALFPRPRKNSVAGEKSSTQDSASQGEREHGEGEGLPDSSGEQDTADADKLCSGLEDSWTALLDESDSDSSDPTNTNHHITHLDLTNSLLETTFSFPLPLVYLERFLFSGSLLPPPLDMLLPPTSTQSRTDCPAPSLPPKLTLRLPALSHLSLAYPKMRMSTAQVWSTQSPENLPHLLSFLPTLTHLSIAGWPQPRFHPLHSGSEWENTAFARLAKATYCLKWLEVTGWPAWVVSRMVDCCDVNGGGGAVWGGWWRRLETVVWLNEAFRPAPEPSESPGKRNFRYVGLSDLTEMKEHWERTVVKTRREVGVGGRVEFVVWCS